MDELPMSLLLDKIARAAAARYADALAGTGLRPRHVGLLAAVVRLPSASQVAVGAWLGLGPSAIVALVDEAEALGLVSRAPDPDDRRRVRLAVTAAGRTAWDSARGAAEQLDAQLVDVEDQPGFRRVLERAAAALGLAGAGSAADAPA